MPLKNIAALLRNYSSPHGEKLPFVWSIDTDFRRALGWDFLYAISF